MPPEALHTAITTPMIRAVSELAAERWMADVDGLAEHVRGAGGQRLGQAVDQVLHHAGVEVDQLGQAEQGDQGREQRQEPVVGQAARGHAAPVGDELLPGPLERVLPAGPAQLQRCVRGARYLVRRGYRLVGLPGGACMLRLR